MADLKPTKKIKPKPALVAQMPESTDISDAPAADAVPGDVKKGELLNLVAAASGVKRAETKAVVEATLAVLAAQMAAGRTIKTPELGVLKAVKRKDSPNGAKIICRLKLPDPAAPKEE
jgi:hypothetical protein